MAVVRFFVNCPPVPQPRQRHAVVNGRMRNYTREDHPVNTFKDFVCLAAKQAYQGPLLKGPLRVSLLFLLPRPKRIVWKTRPMPRIWAAVTPDRDNLEKAVNDALTGILWVDDGQVCDGVVQKMYACGDESPGVIVEVVKLLSR